MSPDESGRQSGESREWTAQAVNWTANHFTISDTEANVPRLLRKVADSIDQLGDIEILDLCFSNQVEGKFLQSKLTVYFAFPGE